MSEVFIHSATLMIPRKIRRRAVTVCRFLALIPILTFALFPFLWVLRTAFSAPNDVFSLQPTLLPQHWTLSNFTRVVESSTNPFVRQFINTISVSVVSTIACLSLSMTGAYALARYRFRGKTAYGSLLILVQLFPQVLLAIPLFVLLYRAGLVNSLVGLTVAYTALNLPFTIWVLRIYILSLPEDIEDAGRIDGCSDWGVLFRIVLPALRPGLVAVGALAFIACWNDLILALVLINNPDKQVIGVGLTQYISNYTIDYSGLFAMATLVTIPVVILFIFLQRNLVSGLSAGAIK
jgi:multiple sugar transport system permease protein